MYHTIMVPLDGSSFAEQAIALAVGLASRSSAILHLVHVREPLDEAAPEVPTRDPDYPAALAERITASTGVEAIAVQLDGKATDRLSAYTTAERIDLIVIATHGLGGLKRALIGSVASALIRELRTPVLTFRPTADEVEVRSPAAPPDHILVPLDGSQFAETVLEHAVALGGDDARVSLIRVVPAPVPNDPVSVSLALTTSPPELEEERAEALAYLERTADRLVQRVRRVDTAVILEPEPADSILDYADQNEVDTIAISTHGRGGFKRAALGSVADELIRKADVPVLVFRPPEP